MNNQIEILNKIIRDRQSVFPSSFDPHRKIEDKVIKEILENAIWAPSHGLTQPWFFKVFYSKGVYTFFEALKEIYKSVTPIDKFSEIKYNKYTQKAELVSHVVVVYMKKDPRGIIPEIEEIVATGCAIQNIYLSFKSYGIGGYFSTGSIAYTKQVHDFLGLTDEEKVLGFFQLGIPDANMKEKQRKRIPASEKTTWISE
ncbi:MAG: nitroreductase [Bacteroidales bacterium]|nr:nitroreductase [Bacteroidales bacterium]